jgi:hypothetical protein
VTKKIGQEEERKKKQTLRERMSKQLTLIILE